MNRRLILKFLLLAGCGLLFASCASLVSSTQYKEFVGGQVSTGNGGTKRVVEGVDVWENGEPNRPFRVIGIIEDETLENRGAAPGTVNVLNVASATAIAGREKRLVLEAKGHGADAIIYVAANRNFLNAGQYETNFKQQTKVAAIKYVDFSSLDKFPMLARPQAEIEKAVGSGRTIPLAEVGLTPSPDNFLFEAKAYQLGTLVFVAIYREGKTDAVAFMTDSPFTPEQLSGLLKSCAESHEWQSIEPITPGTKQWIRTDGNYYAVALMDHGGFVVANRRTLPPTK